MALGSNTLEYVISIVFNQGQVRGATQAMDALEKKANANADAMKKLGGGNKEIERSYSDATQKINGVITPLIALTQKFKDNKGEISEVTRYYERHGRTVSEIKNMTEATIGTMGKHTQSIGALAAGFAKLALRAAVVVPIWMIIRTVFGTIQKLITDSLQTWVDLSKEMARVGSTGKEAAANMDLLKSVVLDFSRNSSRGFKEAAAAMYQLGSAGLTVTEMIQGMPSIMNLAIAAFADTEQTAKLVAGAYNVFGNSIEGAYTVSEKFKTMTDILAYTYAKQQVELEDLSNAMSYVASAAGLMNVDFGDLVTTIGVLNTGLLRGSKAGVALMNSFVQIASESDKLAKLDVVFDPTKPLDFVDVVDQLHAKFGDAALSLTNLKEIIDVFGQRGGRAMAQLIADYARWKEAIGDARKNYKDFAEDMAEVAQKSLPAAWEKMWNSMKANMIQSLSGVEGFFIKTLENMAKAMERGAFLKEFKDKLSPEQVTKFKTGSPEQKDELMKQLAGAKELWILEKQVKAELEVEKITRSQNTQHAKTLNDVIKDVVASGGNEVEMQKQIRNWVIETNGSLKMSEEVIDRIVRKQMDQIKTQKAVNDAAIEFTTTELNAMRDMENAVKYERMRAGGAQESYVAYVELNDLIANSNNEIQKFNDKQKENAKTGDKKVEDQKAFLDLQSVINSKTNEELLVLKQIGGQEGQINKIIEARNALVTKMYAQQMEYAMKLRSDMSSVFKDVLMGEEDIRNTGLKIGDAMRDSIAGAIGNSLSMGILQTGLGDTFGAMGVAFENMFSGPGGMFTSAIVQGSKVGGPLIGTSIEDSSTIGAKKFYDAIIDASSIAAGYEAAKKGEPFIPPGGDDGGFGNITLKGGLEEQTNKALTEPGEFLSVDKAMAIASSSEVKAIFDKQVQMDAEIASTKRQILAKYEAEMYPLGKPMEGGTGQDIGHGSPWAALSKAKYISAPHAEDKPYTYDWERDTYTNPSAKVGESMPQVQYDWKELMNPPGTTNVDQLSTLLATQEQQRAELDRQMNEAMTATVNKMANDVVVSTEKGASAGSEKGTTAGAATFATSLQGFFQSLMGGGGAGGMVAGAAGVFGAAGAMGGTMPFFQTPIGGVGGLVKDPKTGKYRTAAGKPAATYGDMFGGAVSGALMGYSQYQSMTSRGANPMYAGISGGLMGAGGFLTTMGMASGAFPIAGVGMIMMLAGYLMDAFNPQKKSTTEIKESSKTETKQITSKIEVTNKQLELVNRNLIAMRSDLTYIMQQSYYFRERNTEDRFAIDSQRGNM